RPHPGGLRIADPAAPLPAPRGPAGDRPDGVGVRSLLSGAVVVETLFARPGLGRLLIDATHARDVPVVIGVVLVVALGYVLIMAVTDLLERLIDPRAARAVSE